jgi:hypothetical protein
VTICFPGTRNTIALLLLLWLVAVFALLLLLLLLLQILNPAETFGDIIVDYSYVECTSACVTALSAFDRLYPDSRCAHRTSELSMHLMSECLSSVQ